MVVEWHEEGKDVCSGEDCGKMRGRNRQGLWPAGYMIGATVLAVSLGVYWSRRFRERLYRPTQDREILKAHAAMNLPLVLAGGRLKTNYI